MYVYDHRRTIAATWILVAGLVTGAGAQPTSPHHGFLGGPWEILAKMGHEGTAIRLPVSVEDENKPQEMDAMLPVMGTPIVVKVKRYLPNLVWETAAIADPNGGPAARLALRGENLRQDLWLCPRDRARQSISAHIGAVAIRELPREDAAGEALRQLTEPGVIGILLLWLDNVNSPLVYAVRPGWSAELPGSRGKVSILRYVPHYSINRETKEVTNLSDKPVNPAIEICVEGGPKESRQWLWSQFGMSPHKIDTLPFRAKFLDFDLGSAAGQYILAVTQDGQAYLLHLKDGERSLDRVEIGKPYNFNDERYTFSVTELRDKVAIADTWKNGSETLLRPAIVAEINQEAEAREVVLELNKPCHQTTTLGTLVLMYRRAP